MIDSWIFRTPCPEADRVVPYGKDPFRYAELRLPKNKAAKEPIPTVIVIHGGFWLAQFGADHVGHLCARLAELGIATWSLEFRRLGHLGGGFPGTFRDVAAGAEKLLEVAPEHGLDVERPTALGHSAGGHLALWLAARRRLGVDHPLYPRTPLSVGKVVCLAGIPDLAAAWERRLGHGVVEHLMGGSPCAVPERYAAASPAELLPLACPQVLFHGDRDPFVPLELSRAYVRAARAAGDDVRLVALPGAGHFEPVDPRSEAWSLVESELFSLVDAGQRDRYSDDRQGRPSPNPPERKPT